MHSNPPKSLQWHQEALVTPLHLLLPREPLKTPQISLISFYSHHYSPAQSHPSEQMKRTPLSISPSLCLSSPLRSPPGLVQWIELSLCVFCRVVITPLKAPETPPYLVERPLLLFFHFLFSFFFPAASPPLPLPLKEKKNEPG